jgi:hypothetical protein
MTVEIIGEYFRPAGLDAVDADGFRIASRGIDFRRSPGEQLSSEVLSETPVGAGDQRY